MPIVTIELWEGKSEEEKERLIKSVTKALVESLKIKEDWVQIIIHDAPMQNWGVGGKQASKMMCEKK